MVNDILRQRFQGSQISKVPALPGLYAWYYKPLVIDEKSISRNLSSFLNSTVKVSTEIEMRYGLKLVSKVFPSAEFGSQRQSPAEVVYQAVTQSGEFFSIFFNSGIVENFSRPIYIGIAKNLNNRVYNQHYSSLVSMYDIDSPINRYLSRHPNSTVQELMNSLDLPHSFALEARVKNLAPRDLSVSVFVTDQLPEDIGSDETDPDLDSKSRRALERLLQLIADPVCGRR